MSEYVCRKAQPNGPHRCMLNLNHRGPHRDGDVEWPNHTDRKPQKGRKFQSRQKPIRQQSDSQAIRTAFLAGIKAERVRTAGPVCHWCGKQSLPVDLHHITKRSEGKGYDGKHFGVDDPAGLVLLCRHCHRKFHSAPEWSKGQAS